MSFVLTFGPKSGHSISRTVAIVAATAGLLSLTGCKHLEGESGGHVAGWSIIDSNQRHPIMVSSQPTGIALRVGSDQNGLTPPQRAEVLSFLARYESHATGNARLRVSVPSGAANEVAAMHGLADIRGLARGAGFSEAALTVEPYHDDDSPAPPIRLSFTRHVAHAPDCGNWATNLSRSSDNLPWPNLGCSQQRNLAAMIANPADLLGPRGSDARPAERRDATWQKYIKGETTGAQKGEEEKVKVKGAN